MDDVRRAYATAGITVDQPTAYGTYYRLRCTACGANVGNVGDRLLPGMAEALVAGQADLYAAGLLGCVCGHQRATAAAHGARAADGNGGSHADSLNRYLGGRHVRLGASGRWRKAWPLRPGKICRWHVRDTERLGYRITVHFEGSRHFGRYHAGRGDGA